MKHVNNPLTLSKLQLRTNDAESNVTKSCPDIKLFDDRHDFLMGPDQSAIAVLMTFINERCLTSDRPRGIRRPVSITLLDVTECCVIKSTVIKVNISKDDIIGIYRADLPFAYADINSDHTYKVLVRDESSKIILGESIFHMFDEKRCGKVDKWFAVESGGISPEYTNYLYRSLEATEMTYHKVRFNVWAQFREDPLIMPELEIRAYFPNGKIETRFCSLICAGVSMREYYVEMPFFIAFDNEKGVCYAELLCMNRAIAGFVFSTAGMTDEGCWCGTGLECLEEYSLDAATERLRTSLFDEKQRQEEEWMMEDEKEEDEFERALQEFISSNSEDDNTDMEEEDPSANETVAECSECDEGFVSEDVRSETKQSLLSSLDHLTGLTAVKEKLTIYEKLIRFNKLRSEHGLPTMSTPLHAMFLGSPGTGKTTVAKMMGLMLAKAGVLSKGHVIVKERANLLGPNYSMEETNTLKAIEEAQGGILLIDEAYQLNQPEDPRDPGRFVIETLMTALADESRRDWMLILAGYPEEMKRMFDMNPGFKSRIPDSNIYVFDDFTESELMEIAERYLERHKYSLSPDAREALLERLKSDYLQRDKSFGNARHVVNMIQTDILPAMAVRVISTESQDLLSLSEIQASDIPQPVKSVRTFRPRIGYCA